MRYSGKVGFSVQTEIEPDVWEDSITEKHMVGDILRSYTYFPNESKINQNTQLGHRISLMGNGFLIDNLSKIAYITHRGVKWEVNTVELQTPRVIVTLGGKYNG